MGELNLSLCYYPTTAILVDDKKSLLNDIKFGLNDKIPAKFYSTPQDFLDHFQHYPVGSFINRCILLDEDPRTDRITQEVDIQAIHREIYNPKRFDQVSVVVIDYAMPMMNGLECCQRLTNKQIKKILLTGEADNAIAVDAFNKGLIDQFIQKSTPQLMATLNQVISDLQIRYFLELSEKLCGPQVKSNRNIPHCLTDPLFATFFHQLCQRSQIVEYYLLDQYGSFLLLDEKGKASWLVVQEDDALEGFHQQADFADAPLEIRQSLKDKQKILFLYTEEDQNKAPHEWGNYLHPAKCFKGQYAYYYAYLTDTKIYQTESAKVLSYQRYSRQVE